MRLTFFQRIRKAFIEWLAMRLPDCRSITPTLGESLDRKLSFRERLVMRLHLFTCEACARYLKQVKFMSDVFHTRERRLDGPSGLELSPETKARFKRLIDAAA